MALLLVGCGGGEPAAPPAAAPDPCASAAWQTARRGLLDGLQLPAPASRPPTEAVLPTEVFDGYSVTPLTWGHPDSDGDRVYAVAYRPEPLPEGPLPLLLNVHGHWGGGVEVDEVQPLGALPHPVLRCLDRAAERRLGAGLLARFAGCARRRSLNSRRRRLHFPIKTAKFPAARAKGGRAAQLELMPA